ncbi:WcaI family glycosyltransferase [Mucilaginibacter arboris]|uniref:WcaI family glycosyltransferase n=1 Tax=Mucilaginibacter arboris TaxID=2682090 RepID=A0A7K1SY22_9SPHI|nr:WcaI family glycosyltransferase [Mucilaginibacter arboris]MVN22216.1 WcaI family glycosyltransferase [Mucilaginibacter arboris]
MAQKRILLIGGNFYPELTGIGKYNGEMMDWLAEQGNTCTVITTYPYYPDWNIKPPYYKKSYWFSKEYKNNNTLTDNPIKVYRCPHYVPKNPSGFARIISDISFCLSATVMVFILLFKKKFDYVITVSPPFLTGIYGIIYKKIKGAKFFYHVQDLQIDAAAELKMIRSRTLINMLFSIEKFILKQADMISSISEGMIERLKQKSGNQKVTFFPNWVDTSLFYPMPEIDVLKEAFGFEAKDHIILYSGAIGEKQGLEAILHTAKLLENIANLKFIICGSGPYKKKLEDLKASLQTQNVFFLPLQPLEKLNAFLNMADVHLVIQKANASDLVMPSKLTAILSVGGLAVITAPARSSLYKVVNTNQIGILAEPENQAALTDAIKLALTQVNGNFNNNARAYAKKFLSINEILKSYAEDMAKA